MFNCALSLWTETCQHSQFVFSSDWSSFMPWLLLRPVATHFEPQGMQITEWIEADWKAQTHFDSRFGNVMNLQRPLDTTTRKSIGTHKQGLKIHFYTSLSDRNICMVHTSVLRKWNLKCLIKPRHMPLIGGWSRDGGMGHTCQLATMAVLYSPHSWH